MHRRGEKARKIIQWTILNVRENFYRAALKMICPSDEINLLRPNHIIIFEFRKYHHHIGMIICDKKSDPKANN